MSNTNNQPIDLITNLNQAKSIYTSLILGLGGIIIFVLLPIFVGACTEALNLDSRQTGLLASTDLLGFGLSSLSSILWARRVNWKFFGIAALALIIFANFMSIQSLGNFDLFLFFRFLCGIGQGAALSIYAAHVGDTSNPEKYYAHFLIFQTASGVIGLSLLPRFIPEWGPSIILYTQNVLCLIAMVLVVLWLPNKGLDRQEMQSNTKTNASLAAILSLLALMLFFVGQGGVWAYLERIGNAFGLEANFIGFSLSLALAGGFFGPLTATWLGNKMGRVFPLVLTAIGQIIALSILFTNWNPYTFTAAIIIYSFFWNFGLPYMIGILVGVDPSGRSILMANPVFAIGVSIAPIIASFFIRDANYFVVGILGAIAIISCISLFISILPKAAKNQ